MDLKVSYKVFKNYPKTFDTDYCMELENKYCIIPEKHDTIVKGLVKEVMF